jgi:hypothetical protein
MKVVTDGNAKLQVGQPCLAQVHQVPDTDVQKLCQFLLAEQSAGALERIAIHLPGCRVNLLQLGSSDWPGRNEATEENDLTL